MLTEAQLEQEAAAAAQLVATKLLPEITATLLTRDEARVLLAQLLTDSRESYDASSQAEAIRREIRAAFAEITATSPPTSEHGVCQDEACSQCRQTVNQVGQVAHDQLMGIPGVPEAVEFHAEMVQRGRNDGWHEVPGVTAATETHRVLTTIIRK